MNTSPVRTFFCALPLLAAFAGCHGAGDGRTRITFWALGAEGEHVAKLIPGFSKRHPDIDVKVQIIPWNAAHEKLLTAFAGESLPDMCQLGNTWIPEFRTLNTIDNLTPWVAASHTVHESSYFPGIWDTNVMDSLLYGVPWYVDTRVLFYRSDLLAAAGYAKPPESWEEWFDISAKMKARYPGSYANFFSTNNEWAPQVILGLEKGSSLLKENNTLGDFSGPEFTEAMRSFYTFFRNGWAPVKTAQIVSVYQAFAEGFFAMYITGPWYIGEFMSRLPDSLQGDWMTAPLPGPGGGIGLSLAGGSSLVMLSQSGHKPAVWSLIEYLSEPEQQLEFYRLTGDLPARVETWRDSSLAHNRYAGAFFRQLNHVRATPKVPEWEQIAQKVREYTELITMDQYTVEDGLRALDREVNVILEKRRWLLHGR
jgi:multiple sugar transport system substrate-binding protein